MKLTRRMILILLVACAILTVAVLASGDDPVVSLSYLNDVFMPKVETKIRDHAVFTVVTVTRGKTFCAKEGCELILRSGEATAIAAPNGGLSDTTDGIDLGSKTTIPANHLLIVPRDDGRGFQAKTDVIIMVKGGYEIQ